MTAKEKVDKTIDLTKKQISENDNSEFYVYINKTNNFINIKNSNNGRIIEKWSDKENDILLGPYSYVEAIAFSKIFDSIHHIEFRENFNVKTTLGSDTELKPF